MMVLTRRASSSSQEIYRLNLKLRTTLNEWLLQAAIRLHSTLYCPRVAQGSTQHGCVQLSTAEEYSGLTYHLLPRFDSAIVRDFVDTPSSREWPRFEEQVWAAFLAALLSKVTCPLRRRVQGRFQQNFGELYFSFDKIFTRLWFI
jgi:hypothetical protein